MSPKINSLGQPGVPSPSGPENAQLRHVSRQYEALFLNQLIGAMRKTVAKGGLIPEGQGEKVYQSMLDTEYAQRMADSEQMGLSKVIYEHLLRSQVRR